MSLNIRKEVSALERMTLRQLKDRYAELFGDETRIHNRAALCKRIAWRLQALAEGDLSERARRRAAELANDADLRMSPPSANRRRRVAVGPARKRGPATPPEGRLPLPGTTMTREYHGRTLQIKVRANGFEFEGRIYKSLSAVAKKITGQHINGYHFFRLQKKAGDQ